MKKYLILFFIACGAALFARNTDTKVILPLMFENQGEEFNDYLSGIIQSNIFYFLHNSFNYKVINPDDFYRYMEEHRYHNEDFLNNETLLKTARDFKADELIRGTYREEGGMLTISFEIIDGQKGNTFYRFTHTSKGGLFIIDTVQNIVEVMIEDLIGNPPILGTVAVTADATCDVYVDGAKYGSTPFNQKLVAGTHTVILKHKYLHTSYVIFEEVFTLGKDSAFTREVTAFFDLTMTGEQLLDIYINKQFAGQTPLTQRLPAGPEYVVKAMKPGGKTARDLMSIRRIKGTAGRNITLDFPTTVHLSVTAAGDKVYVKTAGHEYPVQGTLDLTVDTGMSRVQVYKKGPNNYKYFYHNLRTSFHPARVMSLDFTYYFYKRKPGLCFLPGAAQVYHKEYAKAAVMMSAFFLSAGVGGIVVPAVSMAYYWSIIAQEMDSGGDVNENESGSASVTSTALLQYGMISCGIVVLVSWLASMIDGFVTMNTYYRMVNYRGFTHHKMPGVRFRFDVRVG